MNQSTLSFPEQDTPRWFAPRPVAWPRPVIEAAAGPDRALVPAGPASHDRGYLVDKGGEFRFAVERMTWRSPLSPEGPEQDVLLLFADAL